MSSLASTRNVIGFRESPVAVFSRILFTSHSSDEKYPSFFFAALFGSTFAEFAVYFSRADKVAKVRLSPVRSERIWSVATKRRVWALPSKFSISFRKRSALAPPNCQKDGSFFRNHS